MATFLNQIEKEIRRLTKDRDALNRRIRSLETVLEEYSKGEPHENLKAKAEPSNQGRAQKIIAILKESGRPMHYKEIIERLEQTGAEKFEGVKDKGATMTATLSLNREVFKRVGKGTYALIEAEEKTPSVKGEF
jgi:hypothetical protein